MEQSCSFVRVHMSLQLFYAGLVRLNRMIYENYFHHWIVESVLRLDDLSTEREDLKDR